MAAGAQRPAAITAIISQSGNAYDAGFVESFWKVVTAYQTEQTAETEGAVRQFLTLDATRWQYVTGVPDETLVNPESWYHDYALISRPGNERCNSNCSVTTPPTRRSTHACMTTSVPAGCHCWRCGVAATKSSVPPAHEAFADDLPDAEIHLLDGGHFLLESALDEVAQLIHSFLAKAHAAA